MSDVKSFDPTSVTSRTEFESEAVTTAEELYNGPDGSTLPGVINIVRARVGVSLYPCCLLLLHMSSDWWPRALSRIMYGGLFALLQRSCSELPRTTPRASMLSVHVDVVHASTIECPCQVLRRQLPCLLRSSRASEEN